MSQQAIRQHIDAFEYNEDVRSQNQEIINKIKSLTDNKEKSLKDYIIIVDKEVENLDLFNRNQYDTYCGDVKDLLMDKGNYFVTPINCLGYGYKSQKYLNAEGMYQGLDIYGDIVKKYKDIGHNIRNTIKNKSVFVSKKGKHFLPVGSSVCVPGNIMPPTDYVIASPVILYNIRMDKTYNAYNAMRSSINCFPRSGKLIVPLLCLGTGGLTVQQVYSQLDLAIKDSQNEYTGPIHLNGGALRHQPRYSTNLEYLIDS